MDRRTFLWQGMALLAAGGGGLFAGIQERHAVEVRRVALDLGLRRPLRIAALGDLHFDPLYEADYLRRVMAMVAAEQPDLVCLLGDHVSQRADRAEELAAIIRRAEPRTGIFAALGNHDHWSGRQHLTEALAAEDIQVLRNRAVPLPGNAGWFLGGLDSFWAGRPDVGLPGRGATGDRFILLVHEPDGFDEVRDPRVRLQLSGHTHGGQVCAPGYGAMVLPSWGRRYAAGLFTRGGRHLYVNRGIGTVGPPLRFWCRPEITLLELS